MSTNKIHCHIYHWSVRGEMRWGFVTYFEGAISRGQRQSRNISTQIYHVGEYILNSVCRGHDRHDFLMLFKLFTWHLYGTSSSSQWQHMWGDQPALVCLFRGRMSLSAKKRLSVFSRLSEEALDGHATLPSHNSSTFALVSLWILIHALTHLLTRTSPLLVICTDPILPLTAPARCTLDPWPLKPPSVASCQPA